MLVPEEKQSAVRRALADAFGVTEWDEVEELTRGLSSAKVLRIAVRGKDYLLRVILNSDPRWHPARHYACMRVASDAGIAPAIRYASVDDGVMISDFIHAVEMPADMGVRMARTLHTLHALPPFPKSIDYFAVMDGVVQRFGVSGVLPASVLEPVLAGYADGMKACPRDAADMVACHNDLKPDNILFDSERVWLVDWEAVFLNDRYCDLVYAASFFVGDSAEDEDLYLREYFGEAPGARRAARFFVTRQVLGVVYAAFFLGLAAKGGAVIDAGAELPEYRTFQQRLVRGEMNLLDATTQATYGMLHLLHAGEQMRTERWRRALLVC